MWCHLIGGKCPEHNRPSVKKKEAGCVHWVTGIENVGSGPDREKASFERCGITMLYPMLVDHVKAIDGLHQAQDQARNETFNLVAVALGSSRLPVDGDPPPFELGPPQVLPKEVGK